MVSRGEGQGSHLFGRLSLASHSRVGVAQDRGGLGAGPCTLTSARGWRAPSPACSCPRLGEAPEGVLGVHRVGRSARRRPGGSHLDSDLQVVSRPRPWPAGPGGRAGLPGQMQVPCGALSGEHGARLRRRG